MRNYQEKYSINCIFQIFMSVKVHERGKTWTTLYVVLWKLNPREFQHLNQGLIILIIIAKIVFFILNQWIVFISSVFTYIKYIPPHIAPYMPSTFLELNKVDKNLNILYLNITTSIKIRNRIIFLEWWFCYYN